MKNFGKNQFPSIIDSGYDRSWLCKYGMHTYSQFFSYTNSDTYKLKCMDCDKVQEFEYPVDFVIVVDNEKGNE